MLQITLQDDQCDQITKESLMQIYNDTEDYIKQLDDYGENACIGDASFDLQEELNAQQQLRDALVKVIGYISTPSEQIKEH